MLEHNTDHWRTVTVTPLPTGWVNVMDYSDAPEGVMPDEMRCEDTEPCIALLTQVLPDGRQRIVAGSLDGDGHLVPAVDYSMYRGTVVEHIHRARRGIPTDGSR